MKQSLERYRLILHGNRVYRFDPYAGTTWRMVGNDWIELEEKDAKDYNQPLVDELDAFRNI